MAFLLAVSLVCLYSIVPFAIRLFVTTLFMVFGDHTHLTTLAGEMFSNVISEDETLVVFSKSPMKKGFGCLEFSLKGIDHQGNVHDVVFQHQEVFPEEETLEASLHYLKDGRYLLDSELEIAEGEYVFR